MFLYNFFTYTAYIVLGLNVIVFFKNYRKNLVAFKIFFFYLLFCAIIQSVTEYFFFIKQNNLFLSHYYFIGQFLFLSFFYKSLLKSKLKKNVISLFLILVPLSIIFIYYLNPEYYYTFNLLEVITTSLPLILFAVFYFLESYDSKKEFIYINSGIFIYLISSTFIFSVGNFINLSNSDHMFKKYIWILNAFVYLIYQILIFIDWYRNFRKPINKKVK